MSTEQDVKYLYELSGILTLHPRSGVANTMMNLHYILSTVLFSHQPTYFRRKQVGYSCFKSTGQDTLRNVLKDLKIILRSAKILLRLEGHHDESIKLLDFSPDQLDKCTRHIATLRALVAADRYTAYIPYMLGKIRRTLPWRKSQFATMRWEEVSAVLMDPDSIQMAPLIDAMREVSLKTKFDLDILKTWVLRGSNLGGSDLYIVEAAKSQHIDDLANRVLMDETNFDEFTAGGSVDARAFRLAFLTFKDDWFETLRVGCCVLREKINLRLNTNYPIQNG